MFKRIRIAHLGLAFALVAGCAGENRGAIEPDTSNDAHDGVSDTDGQDASGSCTGDEYLVITADAHALPGVALALEVEGNVEYKVSARTVATARPLTIAPIARDVSTPDAWSLEAPATPERVLVTATSTSRCVDDATARIVFVADPMPQGRSSSTLAPVLVDDEASAGPERFAVIEEDDDSLSIFSATGGELELLSRTDTCSAPARVAWSGNRVAVTCPRSNEVVLHSPDDGRIVSRIDLRYASAPFALVADARSIGGFIAASRFRKELYIIRDDVLFETVEHELPDVRGMLMTDPDTLYLSRWRSEVAGGRLLRFQLSDGASTFVELPFDNRQASDTETGGVPTYLDVMTVTPDGQRMLVPGLQANVGQGEFLDGRPLSQDETLRAKLTVLERADNETFAQTNRILFDDRGLASSVVTSPFGDYAFIAMRGSRLIERQDLLRNDISAGTLLNVGFNPVSLLMTDDGHLIVHSTLSREVSSWDIANWGPTLRATDRAATVDEEPLSAEDLRGKVIFNDAFDLRITKDSYLACAHCHLDGESDQLIWDFTDRDEGLRRTISLRGRSGTSHGPLHWTANFDEVQDFENDMRNHFGGLGFLADGQWANDSISDPLGDPKGGLNDDLDALAGYVATLNSFPESPFRERDGGYSVQAQAGATLFFSDALDCSSCHSGDTLTDSAMLESGPLLHDVETVLPASGTRQGRPLTGLDTPTLHALFNSQTYLHHGQAIDLYDVFTSFGGADAHGDISSLDDTELDALVEFLLSLDGTLP